VADPEFSKGEGEV